MKAIFFFLLMFSPLAVLASEGQESKWTYTAEQTSAENIKTIADVLAKHSADTGTTSSPDSGVLLVLVDGQRADGPIEALPAHKQIEVLAGRGSLVINIVTIAAT